MTTTYGEGDAFPEFEMETPDGGTVTKADLSGIARQDVQPQRRDCVDQERHENRAGPVIVDDEGDDAERHSQRELLVRSRGDAPLAA